MTVKSRRWWIAGLLSLLKAGLGQIYNGELKKAIIIILLGYGFLPFSYIVLTHAPSPASMLFLIAVPLIYYAFVVTDAIIVARRHGDTYVLKGYNNVYLYAGMLLFFGVVNTVGGQLIRSNLFEADKMAASSMEPTLLRGDHIVVDTSSAGRKPKRNDVIVFEYPNDPSKNFIKRIVAEGGDTVELRRGVLYINEQTVEEPYLKEPGKIDPLLSQNNYAPAVVPSGTFFVLGDNRDNSQDSRFLGFIGKDKVRGSARLIHWSWDKESKRVRWNRIGKTIQ